MTDAAEAPAPRPRLGDEKPTLGNPRDYGYSPFAPRLWHGMTTWAWFRMIGGHLAEISPRRYPLVLTVTLTSLINSVTCILANLVYWRGLSRTKLEGSPVFIVGFQRSGTTWLNELLATDPRFGYPSNLQCLQPETYLINRFVMRPLMKRALPKKRPMDDVDLDPDSPQEDEIALMLSGLPSPYTLMAFPRSVDRYRAALQQEHFDPRTRARWTLGWLRFLHEVQFVNPGKRLLLKSPTHTVRVHRILDTFPDAKFIHITRDPYRIFNSNLKLGKALTATQGLAPRAFSQADIIEELLEGFANFHRAYFEIRKRIPEGSLVTVAYEELLQDPEAVMRRIYDELDLGDFGPVEGPLREYIAKRKDYKVNPYNLDPAIAEAIDERWSAYFEEFGYRKIHEQEADAAAAEAEAADTAEETPAEAEKAGSAAR